MKINHKIILFSFLSCLSLAGCKKEIAREKVGPTVTTQGNISCTHSGYCYTCMPGAGGPSCGYKYSSFCRGHRAATIHSTPYISHYDDGSKEPYNIVTYSDLGVCH